MQNTLVVILGPTGVGKSSLAIKIAEYFGTEIISSDSRQFFKEMKIGTAVPEYKDLKKIQHHFIQHISIESYYSASIYEQDVISLTDSLFSRNKILLLVGGSGLYIDAVCGSIDEIPDVSDEIRSHYLEKLELEGIESIRAELKLVDPNFYSSTDLKNSKRILRALEIFAQTGKPFSTFRGKGGKKRNFNIIKIGLKCERNDLYIRINNRVDQMIVDGLEDEARSLYRFRNLNALNTVGYKELFSYFDGEIDRNKAIELIKRNSRRYAKKQLTWWTRDNEIQWFDPKSTDKIILLLEDSFKDF